MTDLTALAREALELSEKATAAPWRWTKDRLIQTNHITRDVWEIPKVEADQAFIVFARTALPKLAEGYLHAENELSKARQLIGDMFKKDHDAVTSAGGPRR